MIFLPVRALTKVSTHLEERLPNKALETFAENIQITY